MATVTELREQRSAILAQAKELADKAEQGDEDRAKIDDLLKQADGLAADVARREKLDVATADLAKTTGRAVQNVSSASVLKLGRGDDEVRAYMHYVRTGDEGALREQRAYNNTDMNVTTAADGGYAVPTTLYDQIIARRDETMIRDTLGCMPIPGIGTTVRVPIDAEADVLFTSVGEASSIGQDAPALYYKDFTLVKYAKYITLSWELLRDEDANLMAFLANWIGRGVAATHNSLLITEALANGTAALTLDAAAAIGAAEVPEFVGKLLPEYQPGAMWILNPTTVAYLQGLTGSAFYFAPGANGYAGRPSLWGYPVVQSSHASAYAASAKSLVLGNFNFMGFREVTPLTTLRDPYSAAATGQVKLWFWLDAVYGVLQAEAINYATHPSA